MAKKDEKQITHQNFDEWMDPPKVPNILVKKEPKMFHFAHHVFLKSIFFTC